MKLTVMILRPEFQGTVLISEQPDFGKATERAALKLAPEHLAEKAWDDLFIPLILNGEGTSHHHDSEREISVSVSA